jgi:carbamoyl-phosphate synthase large subunit
MTMMEKMTVMVTGVGGGGIGEQIIKALRLSPLAYRIVGSDVSPVSTGLMDVDLPYLLPSASAPDYLPALLSVCRRHGVRALLPGSEPELKVISRERARIEAEGVFLPVNPCHVIETCLDKSKTMKTLADLGFACPESRTIRSLSDAEGIPFLPAILKPGVGGGGSANVMIAQTREEIVTLSRVLLAVYPEFIAQEYVGTPETEYTVGVLVSMEGEVINSIALKRQMLSGLSNRIKVKNRTGREDLGPLLAVSSGISQGEIGPFPEITRPCERIAEALGCRSVFNIQCRFVQGKVVVFEINPRFSGTTSLRAMVGYNEPDVLLRKYLLGEKIERRFGYGSGVITRGLRETLIGGREIARPSGVGLRAV